MPANKLYLDDFWDVKKALVVQDSYNVVPTCWMFSFDFLSLFVFVLQFLQPQYHATNAGCIKTFI